MKLTHYNLQLPTILWFEVLSSYGIVGIIICNQFIGVTYE
jgi:hypothetical protein